DIYGQWIEPTVAFDRQENFYIVSVMASQATNPTGDITNRDKSGALVLQKFNFTNATPTRLMLNSGFNSDPTKAPPKVMTKVLYQWVNSDSALTPTMVIDTNLRSFTDPTTGLVQTDPQIDAATGMGPIYIAFTTNNRAPFSQNIDPFFNPNSIKILASADGGNTFTSQVYANQGQGATNGISINRGSERDLVPQLVISQGTPTAPGGTPR